MPPATDMDALTDEWVKKLQFEKRVDLNLQLSVPGESGKVQVGDIPQLGLPSLSDQQDLTTMFNSQKEKATPDLPATPTTDSYLQSIVSTPKPVNTTGSCTGAEGCTCYKCKRQRRRAGSRARTAPTLGEIYSQAAPAPTPTPTTAPAPAPPPAAPIVTINPAPPPAEAPATPIPEGRPMVKRAATMPHGHPSPPPDEPSTPVPSMQRKASFVLRKKPSIVSYEKHLPRPTYSSEDSIYGALPRKTSLTDAQSPRNDIEQYNKDTYQISWQEDETGDDILAPLRTFQSIFEEKPVGNDGLSDLLEHRTKELKEQARRDEEIAQQQSIQEASQQKPPRLADCVTQSYRDGPPHKPLTLYHTMKMQDASERMMAYRKALEHCIYADSGLSEWLGKHDDLSPPQLSLGGEKDDRPTFGNKKSKRSILPLVGGRKQKVASEELWQRTTKLTSSPSVYHPQPTDASPADVLSAASALMPAPSVQSLHQSLSKVSLNGKPYDHVDTPSQPLPRARTSIDERSILSTDSETVTHSGRTGKLWSSLGRKASSRLKSHALSSQQHIDKNSIREEPNEAFEKALDDLCEIMSHVDRPVLRSYLEKSNGDYMATLSVIRADVTAGKL
ncbi:hypothetical protein DM01DRAFT_1336510 [Hesseltinella vesiculosa]|uniref:Uncharacterized protein n=1 Tax=Hesseltinella vesiculosa TaxID=101127 RepID=A0A1X2GFP4_9FUNG|nr:hypothetical protein DM01DRAFT_1336510 [Hesseltinella vesiculosa]